MRAALDWLHQRQSAGVWHHPSWTGSNASVVMEPRPVRSLVLVEVCELVLEPVHVRLRVQVQVWVLAYAQEWWVKQVQVRVGTQVQVGAVAAVAAAAVAVAAAAVAASPSHAVRVT